MVSDGRSEHRGCHWVAAHSHAGIRRMLRSLSSGDHRHHPLLNAAFVTARLDGRRPIDNRAVRWRVLAEIVRDQIEDGVSAARGDDALVDYRTLRSLPACEQVSCVLDDVCAAGGAKLRGWSALLARYYLDIPDTFDVVGSAWVHCRTFRRWLSVGYGLLRGGLADLEAAAMRSATTSTLDGSGPTMARRSPAVGHAGAIGLQDARIPSLAFLRHSALSAPSRDGEGPEGGRPSLEALLRAVGGPLILLHGPPGEERALVIHDADGDTGTSFLDGALRPFAVLVPLSDGHNSLPNAG